MISLKKSVIEGTILFFIFFGIFLTLQGRIENLFGLDDPYYHAKHSDLIAQSGKMYLVQPWAPFHFLSTAPVDPYFLHHAVTALVIRIVENPILASKIIAAIQASLVFTVFFLILKSERIQKPLLWTGLFFISSAAFFARMLLERPFVISIVFLLLIYWGIRKKQFLFLIITSALYILFYNLALLALVLTAVFFAIEWIVEKKQDLKPLLSVLIGLTIGLLLHPDTLNYINIILTHAFQMFMIKLAGVSLPSGTEIQPQKISTFILANVLVLSAYIFGTGFFAAFWKDWFRKDGHLAVLFVWCSGWFLLASFLPRAVEYWVPYTWLFLAHLFRAGREASIFSLLKKNMERLLSVSILLPSIAICILIMGLGNIALIVRLIDRNNRSNNIAPYQKVGAFLQKYTPAGSTLFFPIWSMFPALFYFNTHNTYVAAFDPVFFYQYNPELYWMWYSISYQGTICKEKPPCIGSSRDDLKRLPLVLHLVFQTDYIVVPKFVYDTPYEETAAFARILRIRKEDFAKIFENEELVVYQVTCKRCDGNVISNSQNY